MSNTEIYLFGKHILNIRAYKHACILEDLETRVNVAVTHEIAQNIIDSAKLWKIKTKE